MNSFCPHCETTHAATMIEADIPHTIKGVEVVVHARLVKCGTCGAEFNSPELDQDIAALALAAYRAKVGLLAPEAIKAFRAAFDLTQQELARLLGWGITTLSRYENGAIQDEAHDRALRMMMRPATLLAELKQRPDVLAPERRERVLALLRSRPYESSAYSSFISDYIADYEPDIRSGYRALDTERLAAMVLHFCKAPGVSRTTLNKLLWYADFEGFRRNTVSLSGARYAHLPFGPAPDRYDALLAHLTSVRRVLDVDEGSAGPHTWELLVANEAPDYALFSNRELNILTGVAERFAGMKARDISEASHNEAAYRETKRGEIISYAFAERMSGG